MRFTLEDFSAGRVFGKQDLKREVFPVLQVGLENCFLWLNDKPDTLAMVDTLAYYKFPLHSVLVTGERECQC